MGESGQDQAGAVRSFGHLIMVYYLTRPSFFYYSAREDQIRWQRKVAFVEKVLVFGVPILFGAAITCIDIIRVASE